MGKRWKTEAVTANEVQTDAPICEPFMQALQRHMADPHLPVEHRDVCAGTVKVPNLSPMQSAFVEMLPYDSFNELRRSREEMMVAVLVIERSDGTLWAYDDAAVVSLYHRHAPTAALHVAVIGPDPA